MLQSGIQLRVLFLQSGDSLLLLVQLVLKMNKLSGEFKSILFHLVIIWACMPSSEMLHHVVIKIQLYFILFSTQSLIILLLSLLFVGELDLVNWLLQQKLVALKIVDFCSKGVIVLHSRLNLINNSLIHIYDFLFLLDKHLIFIVNSFMQLTHLHDQELVPVCENSVYGRHFVNMRRSWKLGFQFIDVFPLL